jgi:VanZ family protein
LTFILKITRKKIIFSLYSAFILGIFILAYLGLIPTDIAIVPYYDSIGHFVLFGLWAYLFGRIFKRKLYIYDKYFIPLGSLIVLVIAVLDESSQWFSSIRTFSFLDLFWGVLGIAIAVVVINLITRKHST